MSSSEFNVSLCELAVKSRMFNPRTLDAFYSMEDGSGFNWIRMQIIRKNLIIRLFHNKRLTIREKIVRKK